MGERMYVHGRKKGEEWFSQDYQYTNDHWTCLGKLHAYCDYDRFYLTHFWPVFMLVKDTRKERLLKTLTTSPNLGIMWHIMKFR